MVKPENAALSDFDFFPLFLSWRPPPEGAVAPNLSAVSDQQASPPQPNRPSRPQRHFAERSTDWKEREREENSAGGWIELSYFDVRRRRRSDVISPLNPLPLPPAASAPITGSSSCRTCLFRSFESFGGALSALAAIGKRPQFDQRPGTDNTAPISVSGPWKSWRNEASKT